MSRNQRWIKRRVGKQTASFVVWGDDVCVASYRVLPSREPLREPFVVIDDVINGVIGCHDDFASAVDQAKEEAAAHLVGETSTAGARP